VSLRLHLTPLADTLPQVSPRPPGSLAPGLEDAFRKASGLDGQLARLRAPNALVVTTGQQPGLFTGPLYTLYKALSAAALAALLEERWGRPVVPLFWLANDDHDYAEARDTAWLDAEGGLVRRALADRPADAPLTPMYRLALGADVEGVLDEFERSVAPLPYVEGTMDWLRRHYRPGRSLGQAFGDALAELVAPFGVLCLDITHPAVKRAAAPHLLRALDGATALDEGLARHAAELAAAGRPAPVTTGEGAALVFVEDEVGRDRLVIADGAFVARRAGRRFDRAELARIAEREPSRLSPNVLLRPVIESALLPTVAYVAGPGELAYLPLARPLYEWLEIPAQTPMPRWSGMIVEPRVDRVLDKHESTIEELLAGQTLEKRVVRAALPPELRDAAERLGHAIDADYQVIRRSAVAIDPTLDRPIDRFRHQAIEGLDQAVGKVERHLRRRQATELAQITRARTAVQPDGRPQERVLGPAGFLARYGPGFADTVASGIREWYANALVAASASP
jgi:bacillithiol biosynthesis cysteine-adding enzyme BshC